MKLTLDQLLNDGEEAGTQEPDNVTALPIRLAPIRDALKNLEDLCLMKLAAADSFADACTAAAKNAGLEPSVVKTYVTAKVNDKLAAQQKKAEQLQLLFEEFDR